MKKRKEINLIPLAKEVDDGTIRKTFVNDYDLMLIYCILNNHNPVTVTELSNHYNKIIGKSLSKAWVFYKLKKIEYFGLFEKKSYLDCVNAEQKTDIDNKIIEKHKQWLMGGIPQHFSERYGTNAYYILTDKGEEWVDFVANQLKKIKEGR
jgi:repressor of nif and glnA expression